MLILCIQSSAPQFLCFPTSDRHRVVCEFSKLIVRQPQTLRISPIKHSYRHKLHMLHMPQRWLCTVMQWGKTTEGILLLFKCILHSWPWWRRAIIHSEESLLRCYCFNITEQPLFRPADSLLITCCTWMSALLCRSHLLNMLTQCHELHDSSWEMISDTQRCDNNLICSECFYKQYRQSSKCHNVHWHMHTYRSLTCELHACRKHSSIHSCNVYERMLGCRAGWL